MQTVASESGTHSSLVGAVSGMMKSRDLALTSSAAASDDAADGDMWADDGVGVSGVESRAGNNAADVDCTQQPNRIHVQVLNYVKSRPKTCTWTQSI